MAERALRGTRLGATSYENDRNTDLAPRQDVAFDCPNGHHFTVPFAAEAELPATWECRVCGSTAIAATGDSPSPKKAKPPRSHWDMLMERRTVEDLEAVLAERLAVIRERRLTGQALLTDDTAGRPHRRSALSSRGVKTNPPDLPPARGARR
jgi:RNA polymerase-binding protein